MNSTRNSSSSRWPEERHVYQEQDWSGNKKQFIKYSDVIGPIKSIPTPSTSVASTVSSAASTSTSNLTGISKLKHTITPAITRNLVNAVTSGIKLDSQNDSRSASISGSLSNTSGTSKSTILTVNSTTAAKTQSVATPTSTHTNNFKDKTDVTSASDTCRSIPSQVESELCGNKSDKHQQLDINSSAVTDSNKRFENSEKLGSTSCSGPQNSAVTCSTVNTPARQSKLLSIVSTRPDNTHQVTCSTVKTPVRQSKLLSIVSALPADAQQVTCSTTNTPARQSRLLSMITTAQSAGSQVTRSNINTPGRKSKLLSIISAVPSDASQVSYSNVNTPGRQSKLLSIVSALPADASQKLRSILDPRLGNTGFRGDDKLAARPTPYNYGEWASNYFQESRTYRNMPYNMQASSYSNDPRIRSARLDHSQPGPRRHHRTDPSHAYNTDVMTDNHDIKEFSREPAFRDSARYTDSERMHTAYHVPRSRHQFRPRRSKRWSMKYGNIDNEFFDQVSNSNDPYITDAGSNMFCDRDHYRQDFTYEGFDEFNNAYNMDDWHSLMWNTTTGSKERPWSRKFDESSCWGGVLTFHLHSTGSGNGNYVCVPETRMF